MYKFLDFLTMFWNQVWAKDSRDCK